MKDCCVNILWARQQNILLLLLRLPIPILEPDVIP